MVFSLSVYANCRDPPPCFKKMQYSSNLESCNPPLIGSGKKKLTHLPVEHKRLHYHQQSSIIEREREREPHFCLVVCVKIIFFTKKYANSLHILVQNVGKKKSPKNHYSLNGSSF